MNGLLEVAITNHYLTLMKSSSKKPLRLNVIQIKNALKWIEQLTPKQREKLQHLATVQLAQVLIEAYSKYKGFKLIRNNKARKRDLRTGNK